MSRMGLFAAGAMAMVCLVAATDSSARDKTKHAKAPKAAPAVAAAPADPVPGLLKSPAALARGKSIFVGTCGAYCHKMTAMQSDAPNLFDCAWLHGGSDQEIFHTITHGVAGTRMVAFGGAIPDADIWSVVAYIKSASQCKSGAPCPK
jgi:mono/diheme cytochrome c family protein